jgi:hypothetical protein
MKKEKEEGKKNTDKNTENTDRQIKMKDSVSERKGFAKIIYHTRSRKLNENIMTDFRT